jgi:hypothetical protein
VDTGIYGGGADGSEEAVIARQGRVVAALLDAATTREPAAGALLGDHFMASPATPSRQIGFMRLSARAAELGLVDVAVSLSSLNTAERGGTVFPKNWPGVIGNEVTASAATDALTLACTKGTEEYCLPVSTIVRPHLLFALNYCLPSTVSPQLFACLNYCSPVSTNTTCLPQGYPSLVKPAFAAVQANNPTLSDSDKGAFWFLAATAQTGSEGAMVLTALADAGCVPGDGWDGKGGSSLSDILGEGKGRTSGAGGSQLLFALNCLPGGGEMHPLHAAALYGCAEAVRYLLSAAAPESLNVRTVFPLFSTTVCLSQLLFAVNY